MGEVGLLHEDDRVELIGGEIVDMTPIGWRHAECVNRLNRLLVRLAGDRYAVSVQNPVALGDDDEPQPDFALVRDDPERRSLPTPKDIVLLVEVADTSLAYDKNVKLPIYARAGIPEAWVVDLREGRIDVYTRPGPRGNQTVCGFGPGEGIISETVEGLSLAVDEVLG